MRIKFFTGLCLIVFSTFSFAANNGMITSLHFASDTNLSHKNIVQLQLVGGFSLGACNTQYAAIRKIDSHLISMALTAYTTGKPVTVHLDQTDIYFESQTRCVISSMTF